MRETFGGLLMAVTVICLILAGTSLFKGEYDSSCIYGLGGSSAFIILTHMPTGRRR